MKNQIIYKKLIDVNTIIYQLILRIFIVIFLVYALINIKENPIVIAILTLIGLSFLIFGYNITLLLTKEGIIYRKIYLYVFEKSELIQYEMIDSIIFSGDYSLDKEALRIILPGIQKVEPNKIILIMKDSSIRVFKFNINKKRLFDFAAFGNTLIKS